MMDEDELDPRIQVELEKLNSATDVINKLEIELDEANTTFRMLLNECTRRLKVHSSKNGSAIENARPYYVALEIARKAQQDCQQAAVNFQRANEVHEAAKETVALAESRFMSQQPEWRFDSAWQEMLNHATIKVRDAEKQRAESSAYHGQATATYKDAQEKVQLLENRLRRNVAKSRPYFEEKQRCNEQLAAQKEAVETLAAKVARVKSEYAESLRRLEGISEEIHRKRGNIQTGGCGVREPGVGAELVYKGEQDHCDTSRETTFTETNHNYDAKLNSSDFPDGQYHKQFDACRDDMAIIHTKDCNDLGLENDTRRRVVGDFQSSTVDTRSIQDRNVLSGVCADSDAPRETITDAQTKISFETLHELHFNPAKDVAHVEVCMAVDLESITPIDVCADSEFVCRVEEDSPSISQGRFILSTNGEAIKMKRGDNVDYGATDNNSDISKEVRNVSTERSNCTVKPAADTSGSCVRLKALMLEGESEGSKHESVDIAKVARETSTSGVVSDSVGARGDAGEMSPGGAVTARDDNPHRNRRTFESCVEDSREAEKKSPTAIESSNTSLSRLPDLELSFCANVAQQMDNDGDSATKMPFSTRAEIQYREVPAAELGGGSDKM